MVPAWWASVKEAASALMPERSGGEEREEAGRRAKPKTARMNRATAADEIDEEEELELPAMPEPPRIRTGAKPVPKPAEEADPEPDVTPPRVASAGYVLPDPNELLSDPSGPSARMTTEELKAQSDVLTRALGDLREEIFKTDTTEYKERLRQREQLLAGLLARLQASAPATQ